MPVAAMTPSSLRDTSDVPRNLLALEGQDMSRTRHDPDVWSPAQRRGCVRSLSYDYPNGHEVPPHVHHQHQLVYAVQGGMTISADRGSWIVPANRGVWVPARVEHAIRISGSVSI